MGGGTSLEMAARSGRVLLWGGDVAAAVATGGAGVVAGGALAATEQRGQWKPEKRQHRLRQVRLRSGGSEAVGSVLPSCANG